MQLYVLDRAKNTLATTSSFYSDKHHKELTAGASIFEFTIDKSDSAAKHMTTGNYLVFKDDRGRAWSFTILSYDETQTTKTVAAEDVSIELLNKAMDVWNTDQAYPFSYYFDLVTKDTPWTLGVNQLTDLSRKLVYTGRDTGLGRLLSVLKGFDNAECQFNIKVKQNSPVEFTVDVYKSIGTIQDNIQIVYNNELNDIKKTESRAQFVTALAGIGGLVENQATTDPGLEKHIDFADIDYKDDNFVSPKGDKFLRAVTANRTFNPGTTTYIEDFYDYDTQSAQELLNRTLTQLKERSEPQYTYNADVKVIDPTLDIGDTVTIIDHDYNPALYLQARVATLDKSYTDPTQGAITFCNYRVLNSNLSDQLRAMQNIIDQLPTSASIKVINNNIVQMIADNTELKKQVALSFESANGKSRVWFSKSATAQDGDIAFVKNADGATEIWKFVEGAWKLDTGLATFDDVKKAASAAADAGSQAVIAGQQASAAGANAKSAGDFAASAASQSTIETAAARSTANSAVNQANLAISQAGFANDAAEQAKTAAANAQADAANALGQASQSVDDATTAKSQAANAAASAAQAITDATTAKGQAANALGQANTAINNAANALDKFNNMQIGGRNYIKNSDQTITINGDTDHYKSMYTNLTAEYWTYSAEVKYVRGSDTSVYLAIYSADTKMGYNTVSVPIVNGKISWTFKPNNPAGVQLLMYASSGAWWTTTGKTLEVSNRKLEKGNKATDWSPAPEDVQQQFTDVNGELSQKVSQTTYNVLAGTVDTVNTLAKQNQSTISTLATKTSVDTVNHTATTAQTLAQQNATELLNKVNNTTVNTLTQRVTTTESTLKQTATTAQLALTQKDIDDLNDTVTTQGLDITAMADGLKLKSDATTVNALSQTVDKQSSQLALTATKAELGLTQTNVDNLKKTVTSNTAGMTANANALKLKADSSTVSDLDGRVTSLSGQLDVQSDLISAKVTASDVTGMLGNYATQSWSQGILSAAKNEISASVETVKQTVDNLQVDGVNLLLNSDQQFTNPNSTYQEFVTTTFNLNNIFDKYGTDQVYTISYDLSSKDPSKISWIQAYPYPGIPPNKYSFPAVRHQGITTTPQRFSMTFKPTLVDETITKTTLVFYGQYDSGNIPIVNRIKVTLGNEGNIAWSPAPEDMATQTWVNNKVSLTEGGLSADIQKLRTDTTENIANATAGMATQTWTQGKLDLTADGLTSQISSVQNGLDTKYTSLEQTLEGVKLTANNAVTQSQYTQLAGQFTTTINGVKADLNGLQIGGRNYYQQNTPAQIVVLPNATYKPSFTRPNADCPNGFMLTGAQDATGTVRFNNVITGNGLWTVSFWMRGNQGSAQNLTLDACDLSPVKLTTSADNTWQKYIYTVNITNYSALYNFVDFSDMNWAYFLIKDFKVETGNKATDWSLAPEDQATVADVSSQITQLQNDINLRVKTGDLVSQIDVNAKRILLDGASTYITNTTHIDTGVIKTAMIADAAIDSAKIANAAIDNAKIANASITAAKIADLAVGSAQIADGAISSAKIGNAAITSAKIADASIIDAKIVSLDGSKIVANSITADKLDVNAIAVGLNAYGSGWQITPASIAFLPSGTTHATISLSGDMGITYGDFTTGEILGYTYGTPYNVNAGMDWFNGISTVMRYNGADYWSVLSEESDGTTRPRLTYSRRKLAELGVYEGWTFDASINATYNLSVRGDLSASALHSTDSGDGVWLKRGTVGGHTGFGFLNARQQSGVYFTDDGTLYLGRAGRWYNLLDIVNKIGIA